MSQTETSQDGWKWKSRLRRESDVVALVSIPEHQLLRRIGSGSYGEVWLARSALGAYRAVKIVFRDSFSSERPFERELTGIQKFEPVSRSHEGFIDVLQVGINEECGYFYYVMEAADDQASGRDIDPAAYDPNTLSSEISRRGRLSLQQCLQLGLALTNALAELHKRGLVHRDIKPSNVIFADGVPKLADIGLVADVRDTRSFVGTEGFIPPEGPGKPQADLFSLGMVLYEASTGNDRRQYPELPSQWGQSPEYTGLLELNEVILKACDGDQDKRYQSAWNMHGDLVVVVNGKSVKRLRLLERRMARIRKGAAIGAVAVVIAGLVSFDLFREWRAATEAHQRQVVANIAFGNRAMEASDLFGALPYFAEALKLDERRSDAELTDRLRLGSALAECPKLVQMWFEPIEVSDAEFSPDGKSVVLAQYFGKAELNNLETGALEGHSFGPKYCLRSAVFSPDGRYILTTSESNAAIVWETDSLTQIVSLPHSTKVLTGRFSPDGRRIVTACKDGMARIWVVKTGQFEFAVGKHSGLVAFAGFSHDGRLIVTASHDGTARVWSAEDGREVKGPLRHPTWVNWADFSPDNENLVTACEDHKVRIWDLSTGHRTMPDLLHNDAVKSAEFSADGRFILTASFDGTVRIWNAEDHQPATPNSVLRHGERVSNASWSADGRLIVTCCVDGTVRVWDLAGATMPPAAKHRLFCRDGSRFLAVSEGNVFQVYNAQDERAISPNFRPAQVLQSTRLTPRGDFALTSSLQTGSGLTNRLIQIWSAETGKPLGPGLTIPAPFGGAVPSDDGKRIATYGGNAARVWRSSTGSPVSPVLAHAVPVTAALFNPDADLVVTLSGTNVQIWNAESGRPLYPPFKLAVTAAHAEFSKDGRFLVTCCSEPMLAKCSAQVWNVKTGRPVGEPLRHDDGVLSASFSPDGSRVVTASEDFTAKVWDTATGRQIGLPLRQGAQVQAATFSPDGKWVATASIDHTARVWDSRTGDPITGPLKHLVNLWDVKFLPDGRHLVTADLRGDAFQWSLAIEERKADDLVELADFLYGGNFISPSNLTRRPRQPLSVVWERLRSRHPLDFATSKQQIVRWHEFQVEQSESKGQWAAAAIHLLRLLQLNPRDPTISARLARVKEQINTRH